MTGMEQLEAEISGTDTLTGNPVVTVVVRDSEHPSFEAAFRYIAAPQAPLRPQAIEVRQRPAATTEQAEPLNPSTMRDLPLTRWDRYARAHVALHAMDADAAPLAGDPWKHSRKWGEALVRRRYPDLNPEAGAGQKRRWESLTHVASVTMEMLSLQVYGAKDPTAAVAEHHGVKPATVRSWLHRARQSGVSMLDDLES